MPIPRKHVLVDIDLDRKRATCSLCGPARIHFERKYKVAYCCGPARARKRWRILHPVSNIDIHSQTGDCAVCMARVSLQRIRRKGIDRFICAIGRRRKSHHRLAKGTQCSRCGFVPEHWCQLDVDHIDGNRNNNDPQNLQTLCANCHRMKTWLERGNAKRYSVEAR